MSSVSPKLPLNSGQQLAADGFLAFLFTDEKEFNISGPGGVGKTHLMANIIDEVMPLYLSTCTLMGIKPKYDEVVMTATTNPAAAVLAQSTKRPTKTVHSFMNLTVKDDYATGKSRITKQKNWFVHQRKILFVDECSTIDTPLDTHIQEGTHDCKIVYVGDHCQMAPVMEPISPIYRRQMPFYELTQQMRNADQPALVAICEQLRETVKTGVFKPIKIVPGVIDLLDGPTMQDALKHVFAEQTDAAKILTYTNKRVIDYNDYIRDTRSLSGEYTIGEMLVNNSAIRMPNRMLSVQEQVEILKVSAVTQMHEIDIGVFLEVRMMDFKTAIGDTFTNVPVPVNREHHSALLAYYNRIKQWPAYFTLKNDYPDFRPREAATTYKAQGSTFDGVFIDLEDISTCRNADQAARLLYVGFSRARQRVLLYGNLASKFGGLIN